jgi:hypothetical protein
MNEFAKITELVSEINTDTAALEAKKARLRDLTNAWARGQTGLAPRELPKKVPRVKHRTVNVSATVISLVHKQSGLTAPQIMDKLGLRDSEAAVRSALKKSKRVTSVDKKWYPVPPDPETKTAPEISPRGHSDYIPHAGE